ncbi:MAG: B12-binding domain-containing radical SAM protein [Proteobacteria bacterium]|nr:B12-binding domain-containing radical SAM protein [Pseudomonadota bacterium]
MRFLLINVPIRENSQPNNFPIGLGIIASVLKNSGHEVDILDVNAHRYDPDDVVKKAVSSRADVIGVSGLISTYKYQCWLANELKARLPNTPLISGGGCATCASEQLMQNAPFDALVIGEGEWTALELADAIEAGEPLDKVKGLALRDNESILFTKSRPPEKDLDAFPLPAYELFPTEIYVENPIWRFEKKSMNLISSRGCPMNCHFCYNLFGKRSYRKRGVESIIKEVQLLKKDYDIECFGFVDDNLTINKKHLIAVCKELAKEKIEWGCHGRVDTVDDERLSWMAISGCRWLGFGIESGSQKILDSMNKRATVEQAKVAMRKTSEYGIFPNATFIYGYPGEDQETILDSMRFKIEFGIYNDAFFATPYPGTKLYEQARSQNLIPNEHEFLMSLNNAYDFAINLTDIPDKHLLGLKRRSLMELELVLNFQSIKITEENENNYLKLASDLLNKDYFLPEFKGHILMALSQYYESRGDLEMAFTARSTARQYSVPSQTKKASQIPPISKSDQIS